MKESVFSSIYADDKQKFKDLIPKFKNSKLIFEEDDVLIFIIFNEHDLELLNVESGYDTWKSLTYNGVIKYYYVIDFEKSKIGSNVLVYPNGTLDSSNSLKDFAYKHKLKPASKEELNKIPIKNLAAAVSDELVNIDFFDYETQARLIEQNAKLVRKLTPKLLSDDEFVKLVDANQNATQYLSKKHLLRYKKAKLNPEQRQTLEEQDLYVFLAKDKFVEMPNGMFKKDLEIENLVKVDQYSSEGQTAIAMLQMRARFQDDTELYILWTNRGLIEDTLRDQPWKINDDEHEYLRQAIKSKMIPASKANKKTL